MEIINKHSIELLFGCTNNFIDTFHNIHKEQTDENFLELKDLSIFDFADKFIKENNFSVQDIKNNNCILEKFIKQARNETETTLADISNFLGISQGKIGYYSRK